MDWSCAYDAFFMVFFYIHRSSTESWMNSWSNYSPLASMLHEYFSRLSSDYNLGQRANFDRYRDQFRDFLSTRQPLTFPRHGPVPIDVTDVIEQLNENGQHDRTVTVQRMCSQCTQSFPSVTLRLPTTIHPAILPHSANCPISMATTFTIQQWVNTAINANVENNQSGRMCPSCSSAPRMTNVSLQPCPFLHFDVPSDVTDSVLPSRILTFNNTDLASDHYRLRGIIYHGQLHFTARLIAMDNVAWGYDGQCNMGIPIKDPMASSNVRELTKFQGRQAYIYVYQHVDHHPN
jgi:hypothetical protein